MLQEAVNFSLNANNPTSFVLTLGGCYALSVVATFGGGSVELKCLGADGSTYVSIVQPFNNAGTEVDLIIGKFAANGQKTIYLAPGTYQWVITTATVVSASVARVPEA